MIEDLTQFEKQMNQIEQARHNALLRQLKAELAEGQGRKRVLPRR